MSLRALDTGRNLLVRILETGFAEEERTLSCVGRMRVEESDSVFGTERHLVS